MFKAEKIRSDFPILSTKMSGKPLVYLDNAATSQKPKIVLDAIQTYYASMNANAHRGLYDLGLKASQALEESHVAIARLIGAPLQFGSVANGCQAHESETQIH